MSATVVALIVVGIILTSATTALLTYSQSIPTSGTVATPTPTPTPTAPVIIPTQTPSQGTVDIGVYSDAEFQNEYNSQNSIAWGAVMPGQNATRIVHIRNEGTTAVTLHLTTANLTPSAAVGKIGVSWNKEGTTLAVGATTTATLTLSVSSSISGITSYSVDVVITGSAP